MQQLEQLFQQILDNDVFKLIISKPKQKDNEYKKIVIEKKSDYYQISKYTEKQVFHENVKADALASRCTELTFEHFLQVNAWTDTWEYYILISKKGNAALKRKKTQNVTIIAEHNRKKNYILEEGTPIRH